MKITVKYWGQIKRAAGRASDELELDVECSPMELVRHLVAERGEPLRSHLVDDSGAPRSSLMLVIGDEQVPWNSSRKIGEGDVVTLLPPISGG